MQHYPDTVGDACDAGGHPDRLVEGRKSIGRQEEGKTEDRADPKHPQDGLFTEAGREAACAVP